jgi:hypothetical protein
MMMIFLCILFIISVVVNVIAQPSNNFKIVAYYSFSSHTLGVVSDESGNNNHCTLQGFTSSETPLSDPISSNNNRGKVLALGNPNSNRVCDMGECVDVC